MNKKYIVSILSAVLFLTVNSTRGNVAENSFLEWNKFSSLPPAGGQKDALGVAGPFAGVSNGALIVAGGANFARPYWGMDKQWHSDIWVLEKDGPNDKWHTGFNLDRPMGYGMSITTPEGVICIGGADAKQCYSDVFMLVWDKTAKTISTKALPPLPKPCGFGGAAIIGSVIYVSGGMSDTSLSSAMNNLWSLDLSDKNGVWKELAPLPGSARAFNVTAAQHNGQSNCVYVIGGRMQKDAADSNSVKFLNDVYEYSPLSGLWRKRADMPKAICAGTAAAVGQSHIFMFGGADDSLFFKADELKDAHPGFPKDIYAYHTITDTWIKAGNVPACQVTSAAVKWNDKYLIVSGEVRPRVRTPEILEGSLIKRANTFGAVNFTALGIYLLAMVGIGVYFSTKNKNTDDFFRGGQRLPGWVAGLSIFATMLSSITFVAIPAKVYSSDWTFFIVNMMAIAVAPFVIVYIMPFFRHIDATSAYEYLEKRFNIAARLFAAASFVLFQIGRMAIVMFLPALALSTITSLSVAQCIIIMGVLSVIYCTIGGLEAVVWTDAVQAAVLLGGAALSLIVIIMTTGSDTAEIMTAINNESKLHLFNWDWSGTSFMTTALWVMVIGGIGQSLVPYVSDQGIVQRYLSTPDMKSAKSSIITNAIITLPASLLFFSIGTALFVFYKYHPEKLDPTFQTDAVFPLFIARELPIGISGVVVAGIFAAAQSTVATSMNSIATVVVTDFVRRFSLLKTERGYLNMAKLCTLAFGILGTLLALMFASADIKSLWESFMSVLGLFGGSMCGLFILGIFTKRCGSVAAISGAIIGAVAIVLISKYTKTSLLLYASIGIAACVISGYIVALFITEKQKDLTGLTIHTLCKTDEKK